jgi:Xaa-Pro aminopeptidase
LANPHKKGIVWRMILKYDFDAKTSKSHNLKDALNGLETEFGASFDAVVLTSKDPFLSEYVPLENNPRYGATHFTGSVGDAIYFSEAFRKLHPELKPVSVCVDGRYHLQADQETDPNFVEVVKLDVESNIEATLQTKLRRFQKLRLGLDFERTSTASIARYENLAKELGGALTHVDGTKVLHALSLPGWTVDRPIFSLKKEYTGRSVSKTLDALAKAMEARSGTKDNLHLTVATDDAAFILNARGYHLPSTASFLGYTFFAGQEIILFLPASSKHCEVKIDPAQLGSYHLTVVRDSLPELKKSLAKHSVSQVFFNGSMMNALLPAIAKEVFPHAIHHSDFTWIISERVRKTSEEMNSIRKAFLHSSRAIAKTLRTGKSESQKRDFSEIDLKNTLASEFQKEGAVAHSFSTISGAGAHSAIVHYSKPSAEAFFKRGDLALLDCGAYYEEGFCTDTTRGFFVGSSAAGEKPAPWQTDIYTATLKSAIQVFLKPVDAKLSGREVDALIRDQVKAAGYDYSHGTGHGVGIHVHEDGIRFSTLSTYPQSAYACVSVEPGIYLKDQGGVRVENVVLLQPEGSDHYRYENVVFVGYDWDLIDLSKLTSLEKSYLKSYEAECKAMGTHLTECPL